jgi:WD40 repeat protein
MTGHNSSCLIVIGFEDIPAIHIWNRTSKAQIRKLIGHGLSVNALVAFQDNVTIASASRDWTVRIWNSTRGLLLRNLSNGHTSDVKDLITLSNDHLASSSDDTTILIWNSTSGYVLKQLYGHELAANSMEFMREANCLISGGVDKTIRFWNLTSGREMKRIAQDNEIVLCILILDVKNNSNKLLASSEWDGSVKVWNIETCQLVSALLQDSACHNKLVNLKEDHLAAASRDGSIKIWNHQSGQLLQTLRGHTGEVFSLILLLSDIGNLASCSQDKTVKIWNLQVIYNYPDRANLIVAVDD